jgi:tRNA 2-thiocytidine biosynthesis protein TtcA
MLDKWEKETPGRLETISKALCDIRPSQLSDAKLFDFLSLGKRNDSELPNLHDWLGSESVDTSPEQE